MKIPNIQEIQQIAFNHSSDIGYNDLMSLCQSSFSHSYKLLSLFISYKLLNA